MSKKYVALIDNIVFMGKRYDKGQMILVADDQEMNKGRWQDESAWQESQEKLVKESSDLTDKEAVKKIKDLNEKLVDVNKEKTGIESQLKISEQARVDAEGKLATAKIDIANLQAEVNSLTERLVANNANTGEVETQSVQTASDELTPKTESGKAKPKAAK